MIKRRGRRLTTCGTGAVLSADTNTHETSRREATNNGRRNSSGGYSIPSHTLTHQHLTTTCYLVCYRNHGNAGYDLPRTISE